MSLPEIAWKADRYDKGTPDYYNCPMNKEQYFAFVKEIEEAQIRLTSVSQQLPKMRANLEHHQKILFNSP